MTFSQTLVLGALSGLTILLGMPLARLNVLRERHLAFCNALAIGVLLFLFVDVMQHAVEPVEHALMEQGGNALVLATVLLGGFAVGFLGLVWYGKNAMRRHDAASAERLALLIAAGIGVHNFAEGLEIGNSALHGELQLALLLIVGFGLHNVTEAFGIAAPLTGRRTPWRTLMGLGLIAGMPNLLGTAVGFSMSSATLDVLFLALAGGAILYVVGELLAVVRKFGFPLWSGWGLLTGFFLGLFTDFLLVALGA